MLLALAGLTAHALVGSAAGAATPPPPPVVRVAPPEAPSAKKKAEDLDFAKLMALFDKFFPPQPDPDPVRLSAARGVAVRIWPDGTYGSLLDSFVHSMAATVLDLKEADLAMLADKKGAKDGKARPAKPSADADLTLREKLRRDDPYFDRRFAAITTALRGEFARMSPLIEPQLREGLSRSLARRFTPQQLADLNSFYQSPTGQLFARESLKMWFDSDVMRSTMSSMPTLMLQLPGAMQRVEAAAKSYPQPPKRKKPGERPRK